MKYIDAEKLIAEIERLGRNWDGVQELQPASLFQADLYELLALITELQQEQSKQDITEFEKALDSFGEAYATLVDRDNNPNQGIRINAYHELVQVHINDILSLAKEYVKQEQPEVDLEKELKQWRHENFKGRRDGDYSGEYLERGSQLDIARHFYGLRNRALEEAARHVYESWMGGTMDDVRRDMVELGKVLNARKEE